MATIELYASPAGMMSGLIQEIKAAVIDYKAELVALQMSALNINNSVCDLEDVISSVKASTQTQEEKIESIETIIKNTEQFVEDVVDIDRDVAEYINEAKDEFYEKYDYLKPDSETTPWEEFWEDVCATFKTAVDWCRDHWKLLVTIGLVIAAVLVIVLTAGAALTAIGALLVMIAKGIIVGAVIGGLSGGVASVLTGGSFMEGFEDGAFGGAISGAITGGMGSWLSVGGTGLKELGKLALIGATSEAGASILGDLGDIFYKGENISLDEILFNARFSAILGGVAGAASFGLGEFLPKIEIEGITKGRGSWAHVWATQSVRSLRHGSIVNLKTILKGLGSMTIKEVWDFCLEPIKSLIGELKDSWNLFSED